LTLIILGAGAYIISLILAWRGIYLISIAPLPEQLQPTPTVTATPTELPVNHLDRANSYFNNGKLDEAIAEYQIVIGMDANNDVAQARLARALTLRHRKDQAVAAARAAVELKANSDNLAVLANALDWAGVYDEAFAYGLRATQSDDKNPTAWAYLAEIYADLNNLGKAIDSANKAVLLGPDSFEAHRNLGYVLEAYGNYSRAISEYKTAIQLSPNAAFAYVDLARAYRTINQYKNATATLEQGLKVDPKAVELYDELGWTYYFLQDYDAATTNLKQALKVNPEYSAAYGHLGTTYFSRQNWEDASVNLERALALGGTRLEYYYELGISYINLEKCDKAKPWIDKAQRLGPDDAAVQAANGYYAQKCLGVPPTPTPRFRPLATATPKP
jgi:tetratricopeptide (TPR) repeat protein